jgi:vacuolar-type H+-ATPase subunit H
MTTREQEGDAVITNDIKRICATEADVRQAKIDTEELARHIIGEAEKAGERTIQAVLERAESEIGYLVNASDQKAARRVSEIASKTANRKAILTARAEGRLDRTAQSIAERIVNG